jgi:hypothetical protein
VQERINGLYKNIDENNKKREQQLLVIEDDSVDNNY